MYKGTEYREYDKSLLDRSTLKYNEIKQFSSPLFGRRFRKYGDHFTKLKDIDDYELNFTRDDYFLAFFLCKKEEIGTVDLACITLNQKEYREYGSDEYLKILKENLKEFTNEEF